MIRIGVVVEDRHDAAVVAIVVRRLLEGKEVQVHPVRAQGRSNMARDAQKFLLLASRQRHPELTAIAAACAAAPCPAGVQSGYSVRERTDGLADPRRRLSDVLRRLRGRGYRAAQDATALARLVDLDEVVPWNASFAEFARFVRGCVGRKAVR